MVKIKLEVSLEIAEVFGEKQRRPLVLHETIDKSTTVRQLFDVLAAKYESFGEAVFNPVTQELTGNTIVMLNGRFLERVKGLDTPMRPSDIVTLLPPFSDG